MYIALIVLGILVLSVPLASVFLSLKNKNAAGTYEKIISTLQPYLDNQDENRLLSIYDAIQKSMTGVKEVKTSSNTAILAKYQRRAQTLETNIASLIADISDLEDLQTEQQIKKFVSGSVKILLSKSGIKEFVPNSGDKFDSDRMFKKGGDGNIVKEVIEPGYESSEGVIIRASVTVG